MKIPPLAGVCSYEAGSRLGLGIDETVERLVRYAWVEKRIMEICLYWLNPTPEWELKEAFSLHCFLAAEHAADLRERVSEMRNPPPKMNEPPDVALDAFLQEILATTTSLEKIAALYGALRPALLAAYREHFAQANPLVDWPTRRVLQRLITDEEAAVEWGAAALSALCSDETARQHAQDWITHLNGWLAVAGGISGRGDIPSSPPAPSRLKAPFMPDYLPQRDDRFVLRENFVTAAHNVAGDPGMPLDELVLAMMCIRTGEINVPEAMAYMIAEAENKPWEFYVDMCRQLWDEARHAMMGTVYFEHLGVDWKTDLALDPGFSIRLNQYMTPWEAHAVLYAIEQSFMRATFGGKKAEWQHATARGDALATLFQDFDWADEVLHVHIGRKWCVGESDLERSAIIELAQARFAETAALLQQHHIRPEAQVNWWPALVRKVLGHPTAAPDNLNELDHPMSRKEYTSY
jgi:hypothetical protein